MDQAIFLKLLFFILASLIIFSLAFSSVFFVSDVKNDSGEIINIDNQNIVSEKTNLNEKKEEIKKEVFDPKILKWKIVTASAPFAKRDAHNAIVFLNKIWLLGGVGGSSPDYSKIYSDIWNSQDGETWTLVTNKAPWGPRRAGEAIVFKNKLWILGGVTTGEKYLNDVWYSENGIDWILATNHAAWLPRKGFGAAVFQEKIWVIGGVTTNGVVNDVWYSENGIDWILANNKAPWRERYDLSVEVFLRKLWLSGGVFPGVLGEKETWYTDDGFNWQKAEGEIPWPGRHGHCFLSYKDYLWIIGGWSGYAHGYNDVWYSKYGLDWNELYRDGVSLWGGREDLECVDFNGKIFMLGGMKTNGERTNDVWVLSE
ncbi:MAG: hypothetical protein AAB529_02640 [Patescibacteria group bacterium]